MFCLLDCLPPIIIDGTTNKFLFVGFLDLYEESGAKLTFFLLFFDLSLGVARKFLAESSSFTSIGE